MLWVPITVLAAAAQTARNAAQKSLTARIGTVGATQVRFLYGLPFALLFLLVQCALQGVLPPRPDAMVLAYAACGAFTQVLATVLMLQAMKSRSFGVTTALIKTEPLWVAVLGFWMLGDRLGPMALLGIVVATVGVVVTGLSFGALRESLKQSGSLGLGLGAGALFALSAVLFRGAIVGLPEGHFALRASTILVLTMSLQSAALGLWLGLGQRKSLLGSLQVWRASLGAGLLGAVASQCWFMASALTTAANVRTLGLVEVFFAQVLAYRLFGQRSSRREWVGMALLVLGVAMLLLAQ